MKIDKKGIIAGMPAIEVRKLLISLGEGGASKEWFKGKKPTLNALIEAELIEAVSFLDDIYYRPTNKGLRLTATRFIPRLNRAKANQIVAEFLERVKEINANPNYITSVVEVWAFGSYITNADDLGDIDLACRLERRFDFDEWLERSKAKARASGRRLNLTEYLGYGEIEVIRAMQARNPYIHLDLLDNLKGLQFHRVQLYPANGR